MIVLGIIHLEKYREWIESLGYDREWIVQSTQAEIYRRMVVESSKAGMFSLPLTYDSYLVVINAVGVREFKEFISKISDEVPVTPKTYVGLGSSYPEAMRNLKILKDEEVGNEIEETVAVHLDLNGYCRLVESKGFHYAENLINTTLRRVRRISIKNGGLAYYAGGDNIICFIPCRNLEVFLRNVRMRGLKAGVGIASKPRDALTLAAEALRKIRIGKCGSKVLVISSNNAGVSK